LIIDKNGEKTGFRGIARDVTEKHLAQKRAVESEQLAQKQYEASRRAENRYRAFLKFLPDPVFVSNMDSTVVYLNPAFEKVFGWTLKELEGKHIPFVPDFIKEETRQGIQRLLEEKVVNDFETKRLTKDGRSLDIIIDGAVFLDENNEPAGQVITLRDVTKEKRIALSNSLQKKHKISSLWKDHQLFFLMRRRKSFIFLQPLMMTRKQEKNLKRSDFRWTKEWPDRSTGQGNH